MTRAKFNLNAVVSTEYSSTYTAKEYQFTAVYDDGIPENQRFSKASPYGTFKIARG